MAVLACDKKPPTPPQPQPPDGVETITGRERIGWDQQAADRGELASFRYALYVDGTRNELTAVSCGGDPGAAGFACSGNLPALSLGPHTLELATFFADNTSLESARSPALRVNVVASVAPPSESAQAAVTTPRGSVGFDTIATGLQDARDAAFAPDGRLFVAERTGRILMLRDDSEASADTSLAPDVATGGGNGLLAIAIDPRFERTRHVFVLYTARGHANDLVFRITRLREVNGTLGEAAVVLDEVPAPPANATGTLRFGPDEKLYAAFDAGGDPSRIDDLASYNGKVLRLNPDGTTPADQPGGSPVHAYGYGSPRGIDWTPETGALWIAGGGGDEGDRVRGVRANETRTLFQGAPGVPVQPVAAMMFPRRTRIPALRGRLLVAGTDGSLLTLRIDPVDPRLAYPDRIFQAVDGLRAVAEDPGGILHLVTGEAVFRLTSLGRQRVR